MRANVAAMLAVLVLGTPLSLGWAQDADPEAGPGAAGKDGRGPPGSTVVTVGLPGLDADGPLGTNVPLLVDESGDLMTGDLAFENASGIQFPGGKLSAFPALRFGARDVCLAALPNPGCGDITSVGAGFGLLGGGPAGDVALAVNDAVVQSRVAGVCAPGTFMTSVARTGSTTCQSAVTRVDAGAGLTGGPITGAGALGIAPGGVTGAMLQDLGVGTADLANGAVTGPKLAPDAVGGASILDGSVTTADLADAAVTLAKLAANSVDSTKLADGAVGTADLADAAVTLAKLAANAVDSTKLADSAVTRAKLASSAVDASKLADDAVTTTKLAAGSVSSTRLADGAVTGSKLAASSVDGSKVVDLSILSADLANAAVTLAKLAANSVDGSKVVDGSIAAADVDAKAVQLRVTGACAAGSAVVAVHGNGTVSCEAAGGDITGVAAGSGLAGGGTEGDVTLGIAALGVATGMIADGAVTSAKVADGSIGAVDVDTAAIQARVTGACAGATSIVRVEADGTVACGGGDITGVAATGGLAGGGSAGEVKITIAPSGVTSGMIDDGAVTGADIADGSIADADISPFARVAYAKLSLWNSVDTEDVRDGTLRPADMEARTWGTVLRDTWILRVSEPLRSLGWYTSTTIGGDGLPVVAHYDATTDDLRFLKCDDLRCTAFQAQVLDTTGDVGAWASIAIGLDGFPVISYSDTTNGDLKLVKCGDEACDPTHAEFLRRTLDSDAPAGSVQTSVGIGTDGKPVVAYRNPSNGDLKVAKCGDLTCDPAHAMFTRRTLEGTVDTVGPSLAIGIHGFPVVAYQDRTNWDLKLAFCGDPACDPASATFKVLDGTGFVGEHASLAIGADGAPMVAYFDRSNLDLKLANCEDETCGKFQLLVLDSAGTVGDHASLAIGADGNAVIAYRDATNTDLKVIKCGTSSCAGARSVQTIDGAARNVGEYASITVGVDGRPVVAYRDADAGWLRVAHLPNPWGIPRWWHR